MAERMGMVVVGMKTILEGVVGSTAYGLATADSDEDRLGVFVAPTAEVVGLDWHGHRESIVKHSPDGAWHEVGKFCRLALQCNPTVTELLWLSDYPICTETGWELLGIRERFLSSRLVAGAYGGYAKQQAEKLIRRGDGSFSSDLRKRTAKHGRHCWRLLHQGRELLTTGKLTVHLSPDVARECWTMGDLAAVNPEKFYRAWLAEDRLFGDCIADSVLPLEPDRDAVNEFLVNVRRRHW